MPLGQEIEGYRVIVGRVDDNPEQWSWTVVRPNGVKMVETGFTSCRAAASAGRIALEKCLDKLSLKGSEQNLGDGTDPGAELDESYCSITGGNHHPDA